MKAKLSIYLQPNYLTSRTAIVREQKQFIKIAFAVHLSAAISAERYRSDSVALKSAVPVFVYLCIVLIVHKYRQSAAQSCLRKKLSLSKITTDRTFENRWSRYKEPSKNKAEAYRVYVEHLFLRSDAGDARIFSKDDEHAQRVYIKYGNGVETRYKYDEKRRWLDSIETKNNQTQDVFQKIKYSFDPVGNVLGYANDATTYETQQTYSYDNLYQLISVEGTSNQYKGKKSFGMTPVSVAKYKQTFSFDNIGNMTNKMSTTNIPGSQGNSYPKAELDYDLNYEYDPAYAHRLIHAGTRYYRYDANGNITAEKDGPFTDEEEFAFTYSYFENEDVYGTDYGFGLDAPKETEQANPQDLFAYRRNYTWNERNLLTKSSDRNFTVHYRYGDDGQRALKYTDEGRSETLYFNNFFTIHIPTQDQNNPQGLRVHKHIFVGNSRLVTAMTHTDNSGDNEEQKAKRYYYHSDHLGSAQFVTDWKGRQYEHIEYTPYGELWIEETAPGIDKLPFRFTGKELDEETGLYYYGARYLDPKYSRWLSGDPALNDYIPKAPIDDEAKKHNENLPGMGGIYNTVNLHVYHYAGNNPVKYVDPDGDKILDVSTTLFQEDGGAEPLGKSNLTISGYGCVLTAYTRIGNAIGISEDITLLSANRTAKNNIFVGENKNLLDRWNSGPKLVNRIGEGSGNMLKFDKSLTDLTLNEYGAALEEYKNSFDTYAVTIRLSSGHTVNMNTDGIIRDNNGNYTIKINNTSNLSTHNAWKPEGMNSDVIDKNVYIERIDVFKVEFNGNFNKNILLPN
ncbi:RHS repeat-associated core domain-containing protein [Treponema denticola]|uniref:RHS repeat-associated core domain-containing protein n=1 Tax=Treponema denticola H-22 TaxID=999432 RepID=A0A0E2E7W0_TREDN|nr:RHS repeat-associated core domain-containing protein [Treponema denticola]EMB36151.1 RHS repeat-associated core domain-containing protein [Treponema denticola H-22]